MRNFGKKKRSSKKFGRRRNKNRKLDSNGKDVQKREAGIQSGVKRKNAHNVVMKNLGLDGPFWKQEKNKLKVNVSLSQPEYVFSQMKEKVLMECKYCKREIKYKECLRSNGMQNNWVFSCGNKKCSNYNMPVKNCISLPVKGRKKNVPLFNITNTVGVISSGTEFEKNELHLGILGCSTMSKNSRISLTKLIAPPLENFTNKVIDKNLKKEVLLSNKRKNTSGGKNSVNGCVDGTWMKKGNMHEYNSGNGAVAMVGSNSKKVIGYHYMSKNCLRCLKYEKEGFEIIPPHENCTRNFPSDASSGSMEPIGVSKIVRDIFSKGYNLTDIGKDGDSSVLAKLRIDYPDKNFTEHLGSHHFIKVYRNSLYKIKNELALPDSVLGSSEINKICIYILIMTNQNQGNIESFKQACNVFESHIFNDHSLCQQHKVSWCEEWKDESVDTVTTQKSHYLRFDLTGGNRNQNSCLLRFKNLFHRNIIQTLKDKSHKLTNLAPDNNVENVNNSIHSKGSKRVNYSNSVRGKMNVQNGILHNNLGPCFASNFVVEELKVPSELINTKQMELLERKSKYNRARSKTHFSRIERKARTIKNNLLKKNVSSKTKEFIKGADYSSKQEYKNLYASEDIDWYIDVDEYNGYKILPFSKYDFKKDWNDFEQWLEKKEISNIFTKEEKCALFNCVIVDHECSSRNSKKAIVVSTHAKKLWSRDVFGGICNPFQEISELNSEHRSAQRVHKLSNELLQKKYSLKDHLCQLGDFLKDKFVIAWNVGYDKTVTVQNFERSLPQETQKLEKVVWIEGMAISYISIKHANKNKSSSHVSKKLVDVYCSLFPGMEMKYSHTSWFDVIMACDVIGYSSNKDLFYRTRIIEIVNYLTNHSKRFERGNISTGKPYYAIKLKYCGCKKACSGRCSCSKIIEKDGKYSGSIQCCEINCSCKGSCSKKTGSKRKLSEMTGGKEENEPKKRRKEN